METINPDEVIERFGLDYFRQQSTFAALDDDVIVDILRAGEICRLDRGEYFSRHDEVAADFQIVLHGRLAYYKHCGDHDVLTRHFNQGEQVGFDKMIGLINRDGTDLATDETLLLTMTNRQFFDLHVKYPAEFGIFMLNLARELSHEIEVLEDVIGSGTGWMAEPAAADAAESQGSE